MQSLSFHKLAPLALAALVLVFCALTGAQNLPLEPIHESGSSVTGAFEGWFKNPDGTFSLLFGYFNRNTKQELDIPVSGKIAVAISLWEDFCHRLTIVDTIRRQRHRNRGHASA
jgi:hypothetical protein